MDLDGLYLWLAALRNATSLGDPTPGTPGLIDLLPGALVLLAENLDLLGSTLDIIESYLLLDAPKTLQVGVTMPFATGTNSIDIHTFV